MASLDYSSDSLKRSAQQNQTFLVTGSGGYIGRNLVKGLLSAPVKKVFGICRPGDTDQTQEKRNFQSMEMDILDAALPAKLEEMQPDIILHAVGLDKRAPLKDQLTLHVEGTRHLLQSVVDAKLAARVVLIGSSAEYGTYPKPVDETATPRPVTGYGVSKYSQTMVAQLFAQKYHVPVMIARLFNPYGYSPRNFGIASLAAQIAKAESLQTDSLSAQKPVIKVNRLDTFRDYIHIQDVVDGVLALAERGYPGEVYNLASGHAVPLRLVLEGLLAQSHLSRQDIDVEVAGKQETSFSQGVIQKIISHTGWRPQVTLEQGLREEMVHWREQRGLKSPVHH